MGWNTPIDKGLDKLISDRKIYPVTFSKTLTLEELEILSDAGIITLNNLVEKKINDLHMPRPRLRELIKEAKEILSL